MDAWVRLFKLIIKMNEQGVSIFDENPFDFESRVSPKTDESAMMRVGNGRNSVDFGISSAMENTELGQLDGVDPDAWMMSHNMPPQQQTIPQETTQQRQTEPQRATTIKVEETKIPAGANTDLSELPGKLLNSFDVPRSVPTERLAPSKNGASTPLLPGAEDTRGTVVNQNITVQNITIHNVNFPAAHDNSAKTAAQRQMEAAAKVTQQSKAEQKTNASSAAQTSLDQHLSAI